MFEGSYPVPGQNITLPASGVVPVSIDIPDNATNIDIKVMVQEGDKEEQQQQYQEQEGGDKG